MTHNQYGKCKEVTMTSSVIRLKVKLSPRIKSHPRCTSEYSQSWFTLDTSEIDTIQQFKLDILAKITKGHEKDLDVSQIVLTIDDFKLPSHEKAIHLLRDSDTILVAFGAEVVGESSAVCKKRSNENLNDQGPVDKRAKLEESQPKIEQYDACLIGTSMVRNISPVDIFGTNAKCLFKSISGGSIKQVHDYLKMCRLENLLDQECKMFCITCGSNDVDSFRTMSQVIQHFTDLVLFLMDQFPNSFFLINQLIPRLRCKYTKVKEEFEPRRQAFNNYLQAAVTGGIFQRCMIIQHPEFESADRIQALLGDGIHLSHSQGVPLYVKEIADTIVKNEL